MRIKLILALTAICLLLAGSLSLAITQQSYTGQCPQPGSAVDNWTTVITFNDAGQPIRRMGISCDGAHWDDKCPRVGILGDPGRPSTYYTELANGAWVRFNTNQIGRITEMWGRDANGEYWEATSTITPSGDLSEVTR